MVLHVHTSRDPQQMVAAVRAEIRALDPEMPVWDVRPLKDHIRYGKMRLYDVGTGLIGGFGLIALILAAVGLYGVMAFLVNQRTHEIGIRMALGASQGSVLKSVVISGMKKTLLGLAIGVPLAILATKSVQYLLVGVSLKDPMVLTIAALFLSAITLVAALIPGWRATRVDPLIALRSE
jgi:ABC-type antimicrobial peptide transport system permease subunit